MAEQNAKERARPTGIAGGPGSEHVTETGDMEKVRANQEHEREPNTNRKADGTLERKRSTSYTDLEKQMAGEAERGLAPRTPQEMSLHDELSRTPTSEGNKNGSEPKGGSKPSSGKPEQGEKIEQETQHEKRREAERPSKK